MPEPNEYLAVKGLQAALLAINVAAGSHYSVAACAVKLDPESSVEKLIAPDGPRPFVLIELKAEAWQLRPATQLRLEVPITIHFVNEADPTDDDLQMRTHYRGCADVESAVVNGIDPAIGAYMMLPPRIGTRRYGRLGRQVWSEIDLKLALHRTYGAANA